MKPSTEDYKDDNDGFLKLLLKIWSSQLSVNSNTARKELFIYPAPDQEIALTLFDHWEKLQHWLPGVCDSCGEWHLQRIELPYGSHAHLCPWCRDKAIQIFNRQGWPEATWYKGEK